MSHRGPRRGRGPPISQPGRRAATGGRRPKSLHKSGLSRTACRAAHIRPFAAVPRRSQLARERSRAGCGEGSAETWSLVQVSTQGWVARQLPSRQTSRPRASNPHRSRPTIQPPSSPRFPPWEALGCRPLEQVRRQVRRGRHPRAFSQADIANHDGTGRSPELPDSRRRHLNGETAPQPSMRYVLAANRSHRPGRPLSSCDPRSENFSPAPATRSVTTLETSTSLG
jgi:hypothetical protein